MSISRCDKCKNLVNTDDHPEFYREELRDQLICDTCYDEIEDDRMLEAKRDTQ